MLGWARLSDGPEVDSKDERSRRCREGISQSLSLNPKLLFAILSFFILALPALGSDARGMPDILLP
jgi:hypothetical protein